MHMTCEDRHKPHWPLALACAAVLALSACARTIDVQDPKTPTGVEPVKSRITDQVIAADLSYIQSLRARLKKLNDAGRPLDEYSMCKAQAWVDFGYSEYTDNDRGGIVEEALAQAAGLIEKMEAGGAYGYSDTPVTPHSQRLREDLWTFIADTKEKVPVGSKDEPGCSACALAKLEVQLVWIGNEYRDLGWRHADSEIRAAERYQRTVIDDIASCPYRGPKAPDSPLSCPPVEPQKACPDVSGPRGPLVLPVTVHFAFDRSAIANKSGAILSRIADVLREHPEVRVTLVGNTDVRGTTEYNKGLSRRRAEAVKVYLMAAGIEGERLSTKAAGEYPWPEQGLKPIDAYARARRVTFVFENLPDIKTEQQLIDLQPDH